MNEQLHNDLGSSSLIEACSVTKSYGGIKALVDGNLDLKPSEIHGVIGENGSGKSTLLRIVAGQIQLNDGELRLNGESLGWAEARRRLREQVALVSQELSLANDLTVGENILLKPRKPGRSMRINWRQVHAQARQILEQLGVDIDTRTPVRELKLGSRQMVEIARVIAQGAPVMILDEPTSALSDEEVEPLFQVLRQLRDQGKSIIIVTHRMDELLSVSDRLTVLRDGVTVASDVRSRFDRASLVHLMLGHEPETYDPPAVQRSDYEVVLDLPDIPVSSGGGTADRSLNVRRGEVLGLFGLAGSGCSTVLQRIAGSGEPEQMMLNGKRFVPQHPSDSIRQGIGYVPADRATAGLVPMMSINDNIHVGAPRVKNRGRRVNRAREYERTDDFGRRFSIRRSSDKAPVRSLSGGNQQKVLLAKALANNPKILAVEEPTRGVDVGAKDEIHRILHQLRDEGMSVVVVSTDIEEMLTLCDRFYVMREGVVTGELERDDVTQQRLTSLATPTDPLTNERQQ